jgi:hypothetical protein
MCESAVGPNARDDYGPRRFPNECYARRRRRCRVWLESYERMLRNLLTLEENFAKGTGVEWASTLASTHANFVRETSEVVFSAMRDQLTR